MKLLTYNIMEGGIPPEPSRLEKVLQVIREEDADIVGLQETLLTRGKENKLISALREKGAREREIRRKEREIRIEEAGIRETDAGEAGAYPYDVVFDGERDWAQTTGVALFSKYAPSSARIVGERVKAVEMAFSGVISSLSITNVYLSHVSEATRLPQIQEVLQELRGREYSILMGDFNALSPEDGIPESAVESFSPRMKEKYCRDGKLCYDTIEAVLKEGYVDLGLQFHQPQDITGRTDLSGPPAGGGHTRGIRMDFIFTKENLLPSVKEFVLVKEGLARTASDHFPWYAVLDTLTTTTA